MYLLERIAQFVRYLKVRIVPFNIHTVGRFCMVIPNTCCPLPIPCSDPLYIRSSLEYDTTLYVHENYVAISTYGIDDIHPSLVSSSKVVLVEIDGSSTASHLVASSIADKIARSGDRHMLKALPNSLRILVEEAMKVRASQSGRDPERIAQLIKHYEASSTPFIELKLWSCKRCEYLDPREVCFVKGIGPGYFRVKYLGAELDLKILIPKSVDLLFKVIPYQVIKTIEENVERALTIIGTALELNE